MKNSKLDPFDSNGFIRKGYEDVYFAEYTDELMKEFDKALEKHGFEIENFTDLNLNVIAFRIVKK